MKISAERTKKEKKRKGTSKNLSYFSSRNWWSTIGSGTEARSYTLYNLSEERRRSGKANYRYWWNKWGGGGERTKRFVLTNGIFKAIQARETFLWWNTWKYECETPIRSLQLCPINVRESAVFRTFIARM